MKINVSDSALHFMFKYRCSFFVLLVGQYILQQIETTVFNLTKMFLILLFEEILETTFSVSAACQRK